MKKTKLVLDTNILIYGINEESKYFEGIRKKFESNQSFSKIIMNCELLMRDIASRSASQQIPVRQRQINEGNRKTDLLPKIIQIW